MKNMKKIIAFLLTAVVALSLVACGETVDNNDGAPKAKYTIAMDTTFAPFEMEDAEGNRVGIDIELLYAIAEDQNIELQLDAIGFDGALAAVQSGQADAIMAGCSITEKRKEVMDFSDPYFDSGIAMGIAKDSDIKSYEDLKGKVVCAKTGTESATFINGENGVGGLKDEIGFTVALFDDSPTMYEDVKAGNSAACFDDYPVLGYSIAQGVGLKMVTEMERGSSYGLGVKKGENAELLAMFNEGLKNLRESGKYQEILDKYIQK